MKNRIWTIGEIDSAEICRRNCLSKIEEDIEEIDELPKRGKRERELPPLVQRGLATSGLAMLGPTLK